MAQEGDRVPAVEGQICLVRWVSWVPKAHYLVGMVRPVRDGTGEMAGRGLSRELRTVEVQEVV